VKTPQLQREHGKYQDQYSAGYQHDEVHVHFLHLHDQEPGQCRDRDVDQETTGRRCVLKWIPATTPGSMQSATTSQTGGPGDFEPAVARPVTRYFQTAPGYRERDCLELPGGR
jgi:hypothetical protein